MTTSRRRFLASSASLALLPAVPIGRLTGGPSGSTGPRHSQDAWVARAREQIPAALESRYFQTGGIGPAPSAVIDEVTERLAFQNQGPADPRYATEMARIEPDLRAQLARVFGAAESEVALTHSTSEGISIVAWSLDWAEGDEVIVSNQEHPANVVPWYVLRDRFGIVIREVDLTSGTDLMSEVRAQLSRRTRIVSLSHVSRNNGRRIDVDESAGLGDLLRGRGVRYHLDGAQGPGCVPVDFHSLGCDCYSTCGHKWLLGPKGTGALFVREEVLDDVKLSWAGAHSHETMDYVGNYELLASAARFEFGTRALADFAGFARSVSWMDDLGLERVTDRIQRLVGYAIERVSGSPTLGIMSPTAERSRSGVFVVELPDGCDSTDLYNQMMNEENILASPVRSARGFRLAIHFFNTRDEIDEAIGAIEARCAG